MKPTPATVSPPEDSAAASPTSSLSPANRSTPQTITLPRWIVYCQAALLGVIAATFFVFGLMVGSLTSGVGAGASEVFDCRVSGRVVYRDGGDVFADEGAVVFLLPADKKPEQRAAASSVSPSDFQALDNPAIEIVHHLGGAVVRADSEGDFEVTIDGSSRTGTDYYFLVVSHHKTELEPVTLTKQQAAAIGTFFMPVERLVEDHSIYWSSVNARTEKLELTEVTF